MLHDLETQCFPGGVRERIVGGIVQTHLVAVRDPGTIRPPPRAAHRSTPCSRAFGRTYTEDTYAYCDGSSSGDPDEWMQRSTPTVSPSSSARKITSLGD